MQENKENSSARDELGGRCGDVAACALQAIRGAFPAARIQCSGEALGG